MASNFRSAVGVKFNSTVEKFELVNDDDVADDEKIVRKKKSHTGRRCYSPADCLRYIGRCRLAGLVISPVYGVLLYLYITHLILAGPPFTAPNNKTSRCNTSCWTEGLKQTNTSGSALMSRRTSHLIGGGAGAVVGSGLAISSVFSTRTRCTMVLIVPSLLTRRGRSFMFSFALALLIEGPLSTLEFNVQEVVRSFTCMYTNMKSMAQKFADQFVQIMKQIKTILALVNEATKAYLAQLERDLENATKETRSDIEAAKQEVEEKMEEIKEVVDGIKDVLNAPGGVVASDCKSVSVATGTVFSAVGGVANEIDGWSSFSRRKRDACDIPNMVDVPDVDVSAVDGISLDALKDIVLKLSPDVDVVNMDFDMLTGEIESNSIQYIRNRLQLIFMEAFALSKTVARWASKIFYISIILIIYDAYSYEHSFYMDDAFDNTTINDSLKKVSKKEKKRKVTPMRRWELREKYHLAVSLILSKDETIQVIKKSLPSIFATLAILAVVITDFLFAITLEAFQDNARFGITFPGMEQGVSFGSVLKQAAGQDLTIKVDGFDLSTDECLPRPQRTDVSLIWSIFGLVITSMISCVIEAYFSRLRAVICNAFYSKREKERAMFLYRKIMSERRARQLQLGLILHRELSCRERMAEFSLLQRVKRLVSPQTGPKTYTSCLGCQQPLKEDNTATYTFKKNEKNVTMEICSDCVKEPSE